MQKIKNCIIIVVVVFLLTGCGAEHNMKKGEKFLAIGEYYEASNHFKQAYSRTKATEREKRGQRAAKMAYCYDRMG